jgi:hypothetical protein
LSRIYKGNAASGSISFPNAIQTTNAWVASGSPAPGTTLLYYAAYRNSAANSGHPPCTLNDGFNLTNAGSIAWHP